MAGVHMGWGRFCALRGVGGGHIQVLQGVHHCSMHIGVGLWEGCACFMIHHPSEGCGVFGAVHGMGCGASFVPQRSVEWVGVVGVPWNRGSVD